MVDATAAFSGFSVRDVPEARAFYEGVLGVPATEEHGMLTLQVGGTHVLVYPKGPAHEPASFTVLNFPVPDVDAAVDELTAAGVRFLQYEGVTDERGVNRHGGPLPAGAGRTTCASVVPRRGARRRRACAVETGTGPGRRLTTST